MKNRFKHPLMLALILSLAPAAYAANADTNRFAATVTAAERFTIGDTLVERHGNGPAMILIPGLGSGAWAWQATVRQFAPTNTVYVLTLPGFDGHPAAAGKSMPAALESMRQLIETRKLLRPVLVGHSLGGILSLELAARHPSLVRGVVTIDGLPVFPGTENWPAAQRAAMSAGMATRVASPAAFAEQQQQYMRGIGTLDMSRADDLAKLSGRSDPAAVARYMADAIGTDLRPMLGAIKAPVLVISPYAEVDGAMLQMKEQGKTAYYQGLMAGTPTVTVQSVSPSRHFAMFDQPQKVHDAMRSFIGALPK